MDLAWWWWTTTSTCSIPWTWNGRSPPGAGRPRHHDREQCAGKAARPQHGASAWCRPAKVGIDATIPGHPNITAHHLRVCGPCQDRRLREGRRTPAGRRVTRRQLRLAQQILEVIAKGRSIIPISRSDSHPTISTPWLGAWPPACDQLWQDPRGRIACAAQNCGEAEGGEPPLSLPGLSRQFQRRNARRRQPEQMAREARPWQWITDRLLNKSTSESAKVRAIFSAVMCAPGPLGTHI